MTPSSNPLVLNASAPPYGSAAARPAPHGRRFLRAGEVGLTLLAIGVGGLLLAAPAVFVGGLHPHGGGRRRALGGRDGQRVRAHSPSPPSCLPLVKVSIGSGLILACVAGAAFLADLRRQRWL